VSYNSAHPREGGDPGFFTVAFYVYILASKRNGTLYIGSTDSLINRVREHREHERQGFTSTYDVTLLVWFAVHDTREGAFQRERRMKKWNRLWKIRLIERTNPGWRDLYEDLL
jgi:putative endonuclease